jgi:hypothetical protein
MLGLSMLNCYSDIYIYNRMQSCRDTLTLRFIFGPPKPKGNVNGRIISIGTSVTLAYVLPYAKSVGAECWNIAKVNLSGDPYTNVFSEAS